MASVNPRVLDAISHAMLQGRGPHSVDRHNPDWPPYKMYPDIYDAIDDETADGYNLSPPPERQHMFGGPYAQYQGQPQGPDMPSARDIRNFGHGDPEMRRRFEEYFGTQARERADQGVGQTDKNFIPNPRARPSEAPIGPNQDEYEGDESGMRPETYRTEGRPMPEEVYDYMPGLKDRIAEHLYGAGPARNTKANRLDGDRFDRAMSPFEGQETGNIQDYRTMAIENLIKRGGENMQALPEQAPSQEEPQGDPSEEGMSLDDIIRKRIEDVKAGKYKF